MIAQLRRPPKSKPALRQGFAGRDARLAWALFALHSIVLLSIGKYDLAAALWALIPLAIVSNLIGIKALKTSLWFLILPSLFLISVANPLLDNSIQSGLQSQPMSGGWLSFSVILIKGVSLFIAIRLLTFIFTPYELTQALRKIGLPSSLAMQWLLTLRALHLLSEQVKAMQTARAWRSFGKQGLGIQISLQLLKQFFTRCIQRSQNMNRAFFARGFKGEIHVIPGVPLSKMEIAVYGLLIALLIIARLMPWLGFK